MFYLILSLSFASLLEGVKMHQTKEYAVHCWLSIDTCTRIGKTFNCFWMLSLYFLNLLFGLAGWKANWLINSWIFKTTLKHIQTPIRASIEHKVRTRSKDRYYCSWWNVVVELLLSQQFSLKMCYVNAKLSSVAVCLYVYSNIHKYHNSIDD